MRRMHASAYHTIPDTPHSLVERMRSRAYICQFTKNGSLLVGEPLSADYTCQCSRVMPYVGHPVLRGPDSFTYLHANTSTRLCGWV